MPFGLATHRARLLIRSKAEVKGGFHTLRACCPAWKAKGERKGGRDTGAP